MSRQPGTFQPQPFTQVIQRVPHDAAVCAEDEGVAAVNGIQGLNEPSDIEGFPVIEGGAPYPTRS